MTDAEIDKLTLADVRRIAERAKEALSSFRAVQALMGGAAPSSDASGPGAQSVTPKRPVFDAEHEAAKAALLAQNRLNIEELPEDLKSMEKAS